MKSALTNRSECIIFLLKRRGGTSVQTRIRRFIRLNQTASHAAGRLEFGQHIRTSSSTVYL
jgi:hypothetical protein